MSAEERCLRDLDLRGSTVFDIGGFEGTHALFFASCVGSTGRVFTFEPHPQNREAIRACLERNGVSNVEVRDTAVGRRSERLEFAYPNDRGLGSADPEIKSRLVHEHDVRRLTLEVRTLDGEVAAGRLPDPNLVKIDVEGLEYDVLVGMTDIARRCQPMLFIEVHGASEDQEKTNAGRVIGWLRDHGYRLRHVQSDRAIRRRGRSQPVYAGEHLFCTPRRRGAQQD